MDFTNYIYITWFYTYLGRQCSISVTRSIQTPDPASLSDVAFQAEIWASYYTSDNANYAPFLVAQGLASMLPATLGAVTGFRTLGFREGAVAPVVYNGTGVINGSRPGTSGNNLPSFNAASYGAPTTTYRRKGSRFGWPVTDEDYVEGQTLNLNYHNTFAGRTVLSGPGLLEILNDNSFWNTDGGEILTVPTVVERVPNTAPEGSGVGDRLPTFLVDPVSAVRLADFGYSDTLTTRRNRRLKV